MKLIAESSTTRTEWALVDGQTVVGHAYTTGLNPYFQSRREISHAVRLELPEAFFRRRWEHVYFYGAGCANKEKNKIMESSLVAQFKSPVTVMSDLLGAARGLLVREPGLACILGTGSNSCLYDGSEIIQTVAPLGYVLGDEGSASHLGKMIVSDVLKSLAPASICEAFYQKYNISSNMLMAQIYEGGAANRLLAGYSSFLAEHLDNAYIYQMIYQAFTQFFMRNIAAYDYRGKPIHFVGSTAVLYQPILERAALDFGITMGRVIRNSMPGLIQYHAIED